MAIISHSRRFIFVKPRKVAGSSLQVALAGLCDDRDVVTDIGTDTGVDSDDTADFRPRNASWEDIHGLMKPHILPSKIRERVGERVWDGYFKITVCRNPWDLVVSLCWFFSRMRPPKYELRRFPIRFLRDLLQEHGPAFDRATTLRRRIGWSVSRKKTERLLASGLRSEAVEHAIRRRQVFDAVMEIPQYYFCGGQPFADYTIRFHRLEEDFREVWRLLGNRPPEKPVLRKLKNMARPNGEDYRAYYTDRSKAQVEEICRSMIELFGYRFDRPESGLPPDEAKRRPSPVNTPPAPPPAIAPGDRDPDGASAESR